MRRRQLLQRTPRVEGGEELAVLVFGPRLAGLLRQLRLAALEALDALERTRRLVERAHHQRPLIGAFRREYLAALRIYAVRQRTRSEERRVGREWSGSSRS